MERVDVTIPLKEIYQTKVIPSFLATAKHKNIFAVPHVEKVVVNTGIGKFLKEDARVEEIVRSLTEITGQKVVLTKAKRAVAGFKIREGLSVGVRVTLRGDRMWDFLDRLVKTVFPRIRDFQGINPSVVDASGNINVGIRDQSVFPEIIPERVQTTFGLQVNVVTTAENRDQGLLLAKLLGFPLRDNSMDDR